MRISSSQPGMRRRMLQRQARRAPTPVVEPTRLTILWTVDQSVDPNLCALGHVAAIDISVSTTGGDLIGEFQAPCLAFATTISTLSPGVYVAEAVLVDSIGKPRTTVIAIHPFALLERSELVIDVDFPADSFLDSFERETIRLVSDNGAKAESSSAANPSASSGEGAEPSHASSEFESPETR
jgi:hypothetical protein